MMKTGRARSVNRTSKQRETQIHEEREKDIKRRRVSKTEGIKGNKQAKEYNRERK
jgi:hypothetical protein